MSTFKIRDLMINVIPKQTVDRGGRAGLCAMEGSTADYTPITPHTPVILVAQYSPRFTVLEGLAEKVDRAGTEAITNIAADVGRAAVAGQFMALCAEDMATCANNEVLSPVAFGMDILRVADLPALKLQLQDSIKAIDVVERNLGQLAQKQARDLLPRLEAAVDELKGHKK